MGVGSKRKGCMSLLVESSAWDGPVDEQSGADRMGCSPWRTASGGEMTESVGRASTVDSRARVCAVLDGVCRCQVRAGRRRDKKVRKRCE